MQASPDGAMAAIIGLDEAREPELLAAGAAAGVFTIANRNSPGQIVVSGDRAAVDRGERCRARPRREARDRAARQRRRPLPAHGARRGRDARGPRADRLRGPGRTAPRQRRRAAAGDAATPAGPSSSTTSPRGRLGPQPSRAMVAAGVDTFLEVGPGKVLTGLVHRIAPEARAFAIDDLVSRRRPRPHIPDRTRLVRRISPGVHIAPCAAPTSPAASPSPASASSAPSATTSRPCGRTSSRATPACMRITRWDPERHDVPRRGRGQRLRRPPSGWTSRPSAGPTGTSSSGVAAAKQALADSGLEVTTQNSRRHRRHLRIGRRRSRCSWRRPSRRWRTRRRANR